MKRVLNRDVLREKLEQWDAGAIDEIRLHREAELLMESNEWPQLPPSDDDSIAIEVLTHLDALNVQLITRADIPAMLAFLATPPGESVKGWQMWRDYWDTVDFAERQRDLKDHPYYVAGFE